MDASELEHLVPLGKKSAPKDRFYVVYFIFVFMGMACLLPWNFFITAKEYFQYKLRNTSLPEDAKLNKTEETTSQLLFESYLSIVSMTSNLVFAFLTTVFIRSVPLKLRMVLSFLVTLVMFIFTTALTEINTDDWQYTFFMLTLTSSAIFMGSTAVAMSSLMGLSCIFPRSYSQANMIGQSLGGTFAAVAKILSIAGNGSITSSAFGYFMVATIVTVFCLLIYGVLYKINFSKFYLANHIDTTRSVNNEIPTYKEVVGNREYFYSIFRKTWQLGFSCFMTYLVTLACFPSICSAIKSINYKPGDEWTDIYFSSVVCFLMFNVGDCIGRLLTGWCGPPTTSKKYILMLLSILRFVYIPLLLGCNINVQKDKERIFPVFLTHDAFPMVLTLTLGISNGFLGTLSLMYAPVQVPIEQAEGAGVLMAFSLTLGLSAGSVLSLPLLKLV